MKKFVYKMVVFTAFLFCFADVTKIVSVEAKQDIYVIHKTRVYCVQNKKELRQLDNDLKKRNGKIIIEIIEGEVINKKGDGKDTCGYYIKYDKKQFKKGDKVQSVFVYNPNTNYTDDILYRIDTLIK